MKTIHNLDDFGDDIKYFTYVQEGHPNTREMIKSYRLDER